MKWLIPGLGYVIFALALLATFTDFDTAGFLGIEDRMPIHVSKSAVAAGLVVVSLFMLCLWVCGTISDARYLKEREEAIRKWQEATGETCVPSSPAEAREIMRRKSML